MAAELRSPICSARPLLYGVRERFDEFHRLGYASHRRWSAVQRSTRSECWAVQFALGWPMMRLRQALLLCEGKLPALWSVISGEIVCDRPIAVPVQPGDGSNGCWQRRPIPLDVGRVIDQLRRVRSGVLHRAMNRGGSAVCVELERDARTIGFDLFAVDVDAIRVDGCRVTTALDGSVIHGGSPTSTAGCPLGNTNLVKVSRWPARRFNRGTKSHSIVVYIGDGTSLDGIQMRARFEHFVDGVEDGPQIQCPHDRPSTDANLESIAILANQTGGVIWRVGGDDRLSGGP